ncbi:MAG: hypothetical protein ABJB69_10295, partial [Spartobacteria bacterium]
QQAVDFACSQITTVLPRICGRIAQRREIAKVGSTPVRGAIFLSILRGAFVLASCLSICACHETTRQVKGVVLAVEGPVRLIHQGSNREDNVVASAHFSDDDSIVTEENAQAWVVLVPGISAALGPGSEIAVKGLSVGKDGNALINPMRMRGAEMRLVRGDVTALVEYALPGTMKLIVSARGGEVQLSGTSLVRANARSPRLCST